MKNLSLYMLLIAFFSIGALFGVMSATPGKSESHAILKAHGAYDAMNGNYFIYLPDEKDLTEEEYEALAVISVLYDEVQVVYPD
ncbi:MAG: hypothetical protein KAH32_08950 [Chlamydiia bacterium]|nr:hypothetical protein [Chlamydiia bacterium]